MLRETSTIAILLLWAFPLRAQWTVQSGQVHTNEASLVVVDGDLINQAAFSQSGQLHLTGDLRNEGRFKTAESTISLIGQNQSILLEKATLEALTVEGGGIKSIQGDWFLNNLTLSNGILRVHPDVTLVLSASVSLTGGAATAYVEGFLYHTGTGRKVYPLGANGTYAPATLLNVQGTAPVVGLAYTSGVVNPFGTDFHWEQRVLGGSYSGSEVELTFESDNNDFQLYSENVMVIAAETNFGNETSLGQNVLGRQGTQMSISSALSTTLPIVTVGFANQYAREPLYIPNAFSPHAPDPEDQSIKVYGQDIAEQDFYLAIQDAWGQIVYQTTSYQEAATQGWPGSSGQTSAVYRYLLKGKFTNGKTFTRTGTIAQY